MITSPLVTSTEFELDLPLARAVPGTQAGSAKLKLNLGPQSSRSRRAGPGSPAAAACPARAERPGGTVTTRSPGMPGRDDSD